MSCCKRTRVCLALLSAVFLSAYVVLNSHPFDVPSITRPPPRDAAFTTREEPVHVIVFALGVATGVEACGVRSRPLEAFLAAVLLHRSSQTRVAFHVLVGNTQEEAALERCAWFRETFDFAAKVRSASTTLRFHVLERDASLDTRARYEALTKAWPTNHYSGGPSLWKALAHELFPALPNALLLDLDTLVLRDVGEIWSTGWTLGRLHEQGLALVCLDLRDRPDALRWACEAGCQDLVYCLGGVSFHNFALQRAQGFTARVFETARSVRAKYPDYISKTADQDIWNAMAYEDSVRAAPNARNASFARLPCEFNCMGAFMLHNGGGWPRVGKHECNTRCAIVHFNAGSGSSAFFEHFQHAYLAVPPPLLKERE